MSLFDNYYQGVELVCSGGQSGSDFAALVAAKFLGIPTGGTAAHGYIQDIGGIKMPNYDLRDIYSLKEGEITKRASKYPGTAMFYDDIYYQRTIANAQEANGPQVLSNTFGTGTK